MTNPIIRLREALAQGPNSVEEALSHLCSIVAPLADFPEPVAYYCPKTGRLASLASLKREPIPGSWYPINFQNELLPFVQRAETAEATNDELRSKLEAAEKDAAIVKAAIAWAYCPMQGGYKGGRAIEDTCEELTLAVVERTGVDTERADIWWTEDERDAALLGATKE